MASHWFFAVGAFRTMDSPSKNIPDLCCEIRIPFQGWLYKSFFGITQIWLLETSMLPISSTTMIGILGILGISEWELWELYYFHYDPSQTQTLNVWYIYLYIYHTNAQL